MSESTPPARSHFISCTGLVKIFQVADLEVVALQGLDLDVSRGEMLALVGPSGSGKSTLMAALGGLDRPTAGQLEVGGQNLLKLSQFDLTAYRREQVGFVWQQTTRNLLPYLSARENIELIMKLSGRSGRESRAWAGELLDAVGMANFARQRPPRLSGGQQQRVAIACALANRPKILLGDEPTGEVDWPTAQHILKLLRDLRERYDLTVVMVTHDPRVAEQADRVIAIRDGRTSTERVNVSEEEAEREPSPLAEQENQETRKVAEPPPRTFEELVVLDRAGRLQIPGEQRALAGIGRRARVELVEGGILIRAGDDEGLPAEGSGEPAASTTMMGGAAPFNLYSPDGESEQEQPPASRQRNGRWPNVLNALWRIVKKEKVNR